MRKQPLHPLTAIINQKQQTKSKQLRHDALRWLSATFPKAFDDSISIHPLKIGILQDILAHKAQAEAAGISISKLREAVVAFTRKIDYLTCVKAREIRVDLAGNPTSQVTEEEAEQAAVKIRKLVDKSAKLARQMSSPAATTSQSTGSPNVRINTVLTADDKVDQSYFTSPQRVQQSPNVIIQHKAKKTIDPNAVARLKEKLGLRENA
jgi:ProP effector